MSDLEGAVINGYHLGQCLGKGGVADVYRTQARGAQGGELVIKVFRHGYVQQPLFCDYFLREAEKIGQLRHPHILPFLEYGQCNDLLYVVMPYISGGNLEDFLGRAGGKLSAMQALPVVQQLCSALSYIHEHHLVHGNIKPQNIFMAPGGQIVLADFGIMHSYDDSQQSLTRIGWGSAEYASPEQSLGIQHASSDIYRLGVILFRMLAGVPPFTGQTPVEVLLKHVRQAAPPVRSIAPTVSEAVSSVLEVALQKRSDERYASVQAFTDAFQQAVLLAPVASPVARAITHVLPPIVEPEQEMTQARPALKRFALQALDPTTPIPVSLALEFPEEQRERERFWLQEPEEGQKPAPSDLVSVSQKLDVRQVPGWSADPPEWSPIAQGKGPGGIPESAEAYLAGMPSGASEQQNEVGEAELSHGAAMKENPVAVRLRAWLPAIVVALLLLGLVGALLSAFFLR